MDTQLRNSLVERFSASEWLDAPGGRGSVRSLNLTHALPPDWILVKTRRSDSSRPPYALSIWRRADEDDVLFSIRIIECADTAAAREQLLEELGNFESPVIERRAGANAVGDVAFGLGDTMVLFARANIVVVILNAGPRVVTVLAVAMFLDNAIRNQSA